MFAIRIARNYPDSASLQELVRCANMACNVILEPPYIIHEFTIGMSHQVFQRPFCINCMDEMERAGNEVIVEVY